MGALTSGTQIVADMVYVSLLFLVGLRSKFFKMDVTEVESVKNSIVRNRLGDCANKPALFMTQSIPFYRKQITEMTKRVQDFIPNMQVTYICRVSTGYILKLLLKVYWLCRSITIIEHQCDDCWNH